MIASMPASVMNIDDDIIMKNGYRPGLYLDHQGLSSQTINLNINEKESKKIPNPFFLFFTEIRPRVKEDNPNMSSREVTSTISKLWKEMSHIDKHYWCEKYSRLKLEDEKNKMIKQLANNHRRDSESYAIISLKKPNGMTVSVPAVVQFLTNNSF